MGEPKRPGSRFACRTSIHWFHWTSTFLFSFAGQNGDMWSDMQVTVPKRPSDKVPWGLSAKKIKVPHAFRRHLLEAIGDTQLGLTKLVQNVFDEAKTPIFWP